MQLQLLCGAAFDQILAKQLRERYLTSVVMIKYELF